MLLQTIKVITSIEELHINRSSKETLQHLLNNELSFELNIQNIEHQSQTNMYLTWMYKHIHRSLRSNR